MVAVEKTPKARASAGRTAALNHLRNHGHRLLAQPTMNLCCAAFSGTTESRPWWTSGESLNAVLALISASVTGFLSGAPALILTAGVFGSVASTETTVADPTT